MAPSLIDRYVKCNALMTCSRIQISFNRIDFVAIRRGEVTGEFMVDMQTADINRLGGQQSIVMQPMSNNTHIQNTKYYDNEVSISNLNDQMLCLLLSVSFPVRLYLTQIN